MRVNICKLSNKLGSIQLGGLLSSVKCFYTYGKDPLKIHRKYKFLFRMQLTCANK
mgnify:CR=1 FL=1